MFQSWLMLKYPDIVKDGEYKERILDVARDLGVTTTDPGFFVSVLQIRQRLTPSQQAMFD